MFTIKEDEPVQPIFGAEDDEEEEDDDDNEGSIELSSNATVGITVVEGEADEDEEDDDEGDDGNISDTPGIFYPGLQLPPKYRANSAQSSESDSESNDDYALFSNNPFSYKSTEESHDYYFTSDLQRKAAKQNIQLRKAFAGKVVETIHGPCDKFSSEITNSVADSIIVAQDISMNIKNANDDLAALTEMLGDLKSFPTSLFV